MIYVVDDNADASIISWQTVPLDRNKARRMRPWLALLLIGTFAPGAAAQDPPFAGVDEAVKALGSEIFARREKASSYLFAAGRAAEAALEIAAESKDREVANRAGEILAKFQWGIFADTPKDIVEQIEKFKSAANDEEKLAVFKQIVGQRAHGIQTAARLITRQQKRENPKLRDVPRQSTILASWLRRAVLAEAPDRLWKKELDAFEEMLELCLATRTDDARRDYAAFLHLRGRVASQIPRWRARAELPDGTEAAALLTYLYRLAGDAKNLRWAAQKTDDPAVFEAVLHEQSAWGELAALHPKMTSVRKTLALKSAYHRLAGQTREFEDAVAAIVKDAQVLPEGKEDSHWKATPLFFNARFPEAMQVVMHGQQYAFAYEMLCHQTRYAEAFQLGDKLRDRPKFRLHIEHARTLHELGEDELARKILSDFARSWKPRAKNDKVKSDRAAYSEFIGLPAAEYKLGMHAEALAHASQLIALFPADAPSIAQGVFRTEDSDPMPWWTLSHWWTWLREQRPKDSVAASLNRMHELRQKRMPADELEALIRTGIEWCKTNKRFEALATLAGTCEKMQLDDLARSCLVKLGEENGEWLTLGQFLLRKKQWNEAAAVFAKACAEKKDAADAYYLRGFALVKAGKEKEGKRWMELADWLPLGREDARYMLAKAQAEWSDDDAARQWEFTCKLGNDDEFYVCIALRRMAFHVAREQKFEQAAAFCSRASIHLLWSGTYLENISWISQPHWILTWNAQSQIRSGDFVAAKRSIQNAMDLMPGNIDLPVVCVPALERKGRKADADELFDRFYDHYRKLCKDFPRSGSSHNRLAWLAARCQRRLNDGLHHAREAVKLGPKSTTFLDTLAEVHFQRGEQKLALDAIHRAAKLDADSEYLRKQRERIMAGDRDASIPEN